MADEPPIRLTFGLMEAMFARLHDVASESRTQFQGRLRNLQRLGVPAGAGAGRGRAVGYDAGSIIEIAVALELTELGLAPERVRRVIRQNPFAIGNAARMGAQSLLENLDLNPFEDPEEKLLHMYLYFDPNALRLLTDQRTLDWDYAASSMFYGGHGVVRESFVWWSMHKFRLSLINVTMLIRQVAGVFEGNLRTQFLSEVAAWAGELVETPEEGGEVDIVPPMGLRAEQEWDPRLRSRLGQILYHHQEGQKAHREIARILRLELLSTGVDLDDPTAVTRAMKEYGDRFGVALPPELLDPDRPTGLFLAPDGAYDFSEAAFDEGGEEGNDG